MLKKSCYFFSHVLIWRPKIYTLLLQDFSYMEVSQRNKKKGLHWIMLLLCLLHAIFTQFVLNNFFLHLYLRLCNQKISTKLCLVQYPFSNVKYSCHSTQNSKALKKKKKRNKAKKFLLHCNWNVKRTNCPSEHFALPYYCL